MANGLFGGGLQRGAGIPQVATPGFAGGSGNDELTGIRGFIERGKRQSARGLQQARLDARTNELQLQRQAQAEQLAQQQQIAQQRNQVLGGAFNAIGQAQTPGEVTDIVGQAVAQGVDPSAFTFALQNITEPTQIVDPISGRLKNVSQFEASQKGLQPVQQPRLIETEKEKLKARSGEKISTDVFNAAQASIDILPNLTSLKDNLGNVQTTGPLSQAKIFLNNLGNQLGLDVDLTETSSAEIVQATANEIIVPLVKKLGSNPTDADANRIQAMVPGLGKTKGASFALIDMIEQKIEKNGRMARLVADLDSKDATVIQVRKALLDFNKENQLKQSTALPKDSKELVDGKRYFTDRGVFVYSPSRGGFIKPADFTRLTGAGRL
jgi:hypothetical protein